MIKRTTYSGQLIPIGNANHYDGQQVYTDGKVVYGWTYPAGQRTNTIKATEEGVWVGEENGITYRLARKDLELGGKTASGQHGDAQAYQAYASIELTGGYLPEYGQVISASGSYLYTGAIIALDSVGRLLTYDGYSLSYYTPGQQERDQQGHPLAICHAMITTETQTLYNDMAYTAKYTDQGTEVVLVYDKDMVLVARLEGDMLTYHADWYDQYIGTGGVTIRDAHPLLTVDKKDIYLDDLRYLDLLQDGIVTIDGLRLSIDPTDERRYMLSDHEYSIDARKVMLATPTEAYLTALTPDKDNDGNLIYTGAYTLKVDLLVAMGTGAKITRPSTGGTYIYNEDDNLIADENAQGTSIHTYDDTGQVVYSGPGRLTLENLQPYQQTTDTYTGDWVASKPIGNLRGTARIVPNDGDTYLYSLVTGAEIAHTEGNKVFYFESGVPEPIYEGPGSISTPSPTPVEWLGDYTVRRDLTGYSYHITDPTGQIDLIDGTLHATMDGGSVTVEEDGVEIFNGPGTITLSNVQPTGTQDIYKGDYTIVWNLEGTGRVTYNYGDTYIHSENSGDLIARENGSDVIVYDNTGAVQWTGPGWIETQNLVPIAYEGTYIVNTLDGTTGNGTIVHHAVTTGYYSIDRRLSGRSEHIVTPTGNIELYDGTLHAVQNGENISLTRMGGATIYSGPGNIIVTNAQQEDTYYSGDYTILWTIAGTDPVEVVTKENNIFLYDNGRLIASQRDGTVTAYNAEGEVEWSGTGTIHTSGTITTDDIYIYGANDELLANEDSDLLYSFDVADPTQDWSGLGHIETNNESIVRSTKKYHITGTAGVVEVANYPTTWQIGTGGSLILATMSLRVTDKEGNQQTYSGDPLGLLTTQGFIFAGGVHCWQDWVISQDTGLLWHPENSTIKTKTYTGIEKCFNLSYLTRKWRA